MWPRYNPESADLDDLPILGETQPLSDDSSSSITIPDVTIDEFLEYFLGSREDIQLVYSSLTAEENLLLQSRPGYNDFEEVVTFEEFVRQDFTKIYEMLSQERIKNLMNNYSWTYVGFSITYINAETAAARSKIQVESRARESQFAECFKDMMELYKDRGVRIDPFDEPYYSNDQRERDGQDFASALVLSAELSLDESIYDELFIEASEFQTKKSKTTKKSQNHKSQKNQKTQENQKIKKLT